MRTIYLVIFAIAVVFVAYAFLTVDKRADEQQIRSLIDQTVICIQSRNIGGTASCISKNYKGNDGFNYDRLRLVIAQALRDAAPYKAGAEVKKLTFEKGVARVELHAIVSIKNNNNIYDQYLMLYFQKEPARHKLIVPVKVWRVIKVDNHGLEL